MTAKIERRALAEIRAASGRRLSGYAAIFGEEAQIGGFRESIQPGAFRESLLSGQDILGLADHDATKVLGRTRNDTLKVEEDARGLRFDLDIADTTIGNDILAMVKRGDAGGMSIGFLVRDEAWPSKDRRILRSIDLREVSVISAWPAYDGTVVVARSKADLTMRQRYAAMVLEQLG